MIPELRIRAVNRASIRPQGEHVLYWMNACRRTRWNFALERAVEHARELGRPLVILEALRLGYDWASDRLHGFILDGMRDNRERLSGTGVRYYPYLERRRGDGSGLLEGLAGRAAVVVTDDFPCFFLPRMVAAAGAKLAVRLEAVDSNGLLPVSAPDRYFHRAYDFRRYLQHNLPEHLTQLPSENPLAGPSLPPLPPKALAEIERRWPEMTATELASAGNLLPELAIDHSVKPTDTAGGSAAAERRWRSFLDEGLDRYAETRNDPDAETASRVSPYLHFGHLSPHQIFVDIAEREGWSPLSIGTMGRGQRSGWWGMSQPAEAFLDQLVTWRELGLNATSRMDRYDRLDSLPNWALDTIEEHREDRRPVVYSLAELESAATHDPLWNAAQRQLLREGRIHNYLRMLWGKKIYEWSAAPEEALEAMIHLNNKYALDGRDPNSYSGIFWCLGRYDRAWGPERPIFGKLRYMSSDNARRKLKLDRYLDRYGSADDPFQLELAPA